MKQLFISYSRKDIEFARRLTESFATVQLDAWIDWEDIPPSVDWWVQIQNGIENSDVFIFIISPDSVQSKVCRQEVEYAARNGKRIIPVVVRAIQAEQAFPEIGNLNWIFIRTQDLFETALEKLMTAIRTDYQWVEIHRRLQVKALEWERHQREISFLLRGQDLKNAEAQLLVNGDKDPHPTPLQQEFVIASRIHEDEQLEQQYLHEQQLQFQKDMGRRLLRLRNLLIVVFTLTFLGLSIWLYTITNNLAITALQNQMLAVVNTGVMNINAEEYAGILKRLDPQPARVIKDPDYLILRNSLKTVQSANPNSVLITVAKGTKDAEYLMIASTNDDIRFKDGFQTGYDSVFYKGLSEPSAGQIVYRPDNSGSFMAACTPIRDAFRESVGALCAFLDADYLNQVHTNILRTFTMAVLIAYPVMLLLVLTTSQFFQRKFGKISKNSSPNP